MKKLFAMLLTVSLLMVSVGAASTQPSNWAQEAVQTAQEAGLVPETLNTSYDTVITRAEFCSLAASLYRIWEANGQLKDITLSSVSFTDCTDEDVLLCASIGVVNGVGDGRFSPDSPIQRQEAASMLHRLAVLRTDYADSTKNKMPHVFLDGENIRSWARSDVYWAYNSGVMTGTGDNAFDPTGQYTREQSIVTMLRLYDASYAALPVPNAEAPYHTVLDYSGAGVSRMHLEDKDGNHLLTDFEDTDGYFYDITVFGDWVGLMWNEHTNVALYQPATGKRIDGYYFDGIDEKNGVAWAMSVDGDDALIVYADGTTGKIFIPETMWSEGRAIVWADANTLAAIDKNGNTLWQYKTSVDQDTLFYGLGDRLVIEKGNTNALLANGKLGAAQAYSITPSKWSTNYIGGNNGYYTLYDQNGKALTSSYANALDEVGQDIYCCWVSDTQYEYFHCAAGGSPTTLFTVTVTNGHPGVLPTDGAGVYALQTSQNTIACFDRFGSVLGTIETPFMLDNQINITFEKGCVRVTRIDIGVDATVQTVLYLPTGEAIA
ncbi:S-layer homology domain-containing protein [Agathobaculum sp. LCP25S3_E8]|uniref:S-layer homology domain-containing protein n=1 Tax=Agathobaculum sp. LCP25S3_E8 TaxID=3438735 RepID=UPI003F92700C